LGKPENALQTPVKQREVDRLAAPAKKLRTSGRSRTKLQVGEPPMFNLAIHNKLRGRDVVRPEAEGVALMP
jgi:hypothetical protein